MQRRPVHLVLAGLWLATWLFSLMAAGAARAEDGARLPPPPVERPCRPAPDSDDEEEDSGYLEPRGLSEEEIALAMEEVLPRLERCVPPGTALSARPQLHVETACSGRVRSVRVVEGADLPPSMLSCFAATLRETAFPPHDAVEGFGFDYRLRLQYLVPPRSAARR